MKTKLIDYFLSILLSLFKSSKEFQTLEQFYEFQDQSQNLKAMIKTIEDEINNYKKVSHREQWIRI